MEPMTLGAVALTPSQPLRGDLAAFRNGAVIQARVLAMLEANMARLSLLGQTIDVSTPVPLKPGTSLPVSVEHSEGGLKLLIKGDAIQPQVAAQAAKAGSPPTLVASLGPFLTAAQVAITNAILSAESKLASSPQAPEQSAAQQNRTSEQAATQTKALQAQPQAAAPTPMPMQMRPEPSTLAPFIRDLVPATAREPEPPSPSLLMQAPQASAAYAQNASAAPTQYSAQAIVIPFQLPQMPYPIEVRVERQEDDSEEGRALSESGERCWRVSFSFEAGGLGPVHVSIGLRAGAVSVKFAAEDARSATDLRAWLPELKTALEASDLTVDELSARLGTAAFDPPSQSLSITI
jgi:hypothetical protein